MKKYILKSDKYPNMCIDDNGSSVRGQHYLHLWQCEKYNRNQQFIFDSSNNKKEKCTFKLKNTNKKNLCIDDAGNITTHKPYHIMWSCDENSENQEYNIYDYVQENGVKKIKIRNPHKKLWVSTNGNKIKYDKCEHSDWFIPLNVQ